jgi:class 3 adenylate cyclase/pimeloyl-ACP methyl ester carboxylesterase
MTEIQYTKSGDRYVAYRVEGDGPLDLLVCDEITMVSIDSKNEEPHWNRFHHKLASFARVITFDRAGIGLTDAPPPGAPVTLEDWVDDARAVIAAAGCDRVAILGCCCAAIAVSIAVREPELVSHLVLFNGFAHSERLSVGSWLETFPEWLEETTRAQPAGDIVDDVAVLLPSLADDDGFRRWWQQAGQRGASPKTAAEQNEVVIGLDLRPVLPRVHVPSLVVCRTEAAFAARTESLQLVSLLPDATLVELPGADFFPFAGDTDSVVEEIEEFLTGSRNAGQVDRVLTTILFTDIVESTSAAARLGDQRWGALLDLHDRLVRRELVRHGGTEIKTTGDGFLARFDVPSRAIRCGIAVCQAAREAGMEIRVGIHTGEVELRDGDVGGVGVHVAARVLAAAAPGQVLVTSTAREAVTGSGLEFQDAGEHTLRGVPGAWRLFSVAE